MKIKQRVHYLKRTAGIASQGVDPGIIIALTPQDMVSIVVIGE